jgi:hypothetical protein
VMTTSTTPATDRELRNFPPSPMPVCTMRGVDHFALELAAIELWRAVRSEDPKPALRRAIGHIQSVIDGEPRTVSPGPPIEVGPL